MSESEETPPPDDNDTSVEHSPEESTPVLGPKITTTSVPVIVLPPLPVRLPSK